MYFDSVLFVLLSVKTYLQYWKLFEAPTRESDKTVKYGYAKCVE
jgi:hypothetical protein